MELPRLNEQQQDLVERIGVVHDRLGLPPACGRILGLLFVSPKNELTFDQIRELLGMSKSSVSMGLNLLQQIQSVEYVTRPGDRKRYFRKRYRDWDKGFLGRLRELFSLRDLLVEAQALRESGPAEADQGLQEMVDLLGYLREEIDDAVKRWKSGKASIPMK